MYLVEFLLLPYCFGVFKAADSSTVGTVLLTNYYRKAGVPPAVHNNDYIFKQALEVLHTTQHF